MLYKIGDRIVEITKTDESYGWNTVETPSIDGRVMSGLVSTKTECLIGQDGFNPDLCIQEAAADQYYLMSQTEATEFLYRFSTWTMSEVAGDIGSIFNTLF